VASFTAETLSRREVDIFLALRVGSEKEFTDLWPG